MYSLNKIKRFDEYSSYFELNESLTNGTQSVCNQAFANGGIIKFEDGTSVNPKEIINVVHQALEKLEDQYSRTFTFGKNINLIYLAHSNKIKTMAIDKNLNLYMNAGFIFKTLQMNPDYIAAVLMHEILHALYNHLERGKNWVGAQGLQMTPELAHDNNLAADIEVNQTLVNMDIIKAQELIDVIKGLYLFNEDRRKAGMNTTIVPMEMILENEDAMKKLREMCPPPVNGDNGTQGEEIETTPEWDKGYTEMWNKLAGLIKKYGYKKTWEKCIAAGIVNEVGEINLEKELDDIMSLSYLQVKSFEEYINENLVKAKDEEGQTYENGALKAAQKVLGAIYGALHMDEEGGGPGGESGGGFKSNVKDEDLEEIRLPQPKSKKDNKGGEDNDPGKINPTNNDNDNSDQSKDTSSGKGGSGKSEDELTDDDYNTLGDDLKNKNSGEGQTDNSGRSDEEPTDDDFDTLKNDLNGKGGKSSNGSSDGSSSDEIGGTGTFVDEIDDSVLKDAGYDQEAIDEINEVRERNKERNSPEGIARARQELRNRLSDSDRIAKMLDVINVSEAKYKNVWKEIMKQFLSERTRRAGRDKNNGRNDWKNKVRLAQGMYGIHHQSTSQDPQDVNIYVDVSGSMNIELLEIICKSLVVYSKTFAYSAINICPWASASGSIYKIDDFAKRSEDDVTNEILKAVSAGRSQCGGGTESKAAIASMIDVISNTLKDPNKKKKDDVHVVITDGYFDTDNIENRIVSALKQEINRDDVAAKAPTNTFWMLYDTSPERRKEWEEEIKKGKLIFINSKVVIGNK